MSPTRLTDRRVLGALAAIATAIASANALLTNYGFTGTGSYASAMTAADKQLANSLAQKLDDYNNNRPNACQ